MTTNEDILFVELALKRELVTQEQVDEVLALQKKLAAMGLPESAADLLVKRGILKATDAKSIQMKVDPKGGHQIEGYRLMERLGRGGMGSVYRAVQLSLNRSVAIKVLTPSLSSDDKRVERLKREAQLVARLDHPNIVQGLDQGVSHGFHYFAMEYVEGESVKEVLENYGPLKEKEALSVVTDLAKALEYAHKEGVVHRDIKPGNIMVSEKGKVKLADYGLAKGPLEDVELTQSGVTIGTPQYISPEQASGPSEVDIRTDIYSLGATLYHMVTGRPPYEGDTLAHLIQQVLYEPYAPPQTLRRNLSKNVAFLIEKMMARKAKQRYQNPTELLKDLEAIRAKKNIVPHGWEGDFETFFLKRRLKRVIAVAMLVILVGIGVTVYFAWRNRVAEQKRLESNANQAFLGLAGIRPAAGNLEQLITGYMEIDADHPGTQAASDARSRLRTLTPQLEELRAAQRAIGEADPMTRKNQWALARRTLMSALAKATASEAGTLARKVLEDRLTIVAKSRDQFVKETDAELNRSVRTRLPEPEDALAELESRLGRLKSQAYTAEEPTDLLDDTRTLIRSLDQAIRGVTGYISGPRAQLAVADPKKDYREIQRLLDGAKAEFDEDKELERHLAGIHGNWFDALVMRFDGLSQEIFEANSAERAFLLAKLADLTAAGRYAGAIEAVDELRPRSLASIDDELYQEKEKLSGELATRTQSAISLWDEFVPPYVQYLARRQWPAAELELGRLKDAAKTLRPYPLQNQIEGAEAVLAEMRRNEEEFLEKIAGLRILPEGLLVRGINRVIHEPRLVGREIFYRLKPGGPEDRFHVSEVRVEDLLQYLGTPRGVRKMVFALLAYGEITGSSNIRRLQDVIPVLKDGIITGANEPPFTMFRDDMVNVLDREVDSAVASAIRAEEEAEKRFKKGEEHFKNAQYQDAFDAFDQLLRDEPHKDTDFVRRKRAEIEDRRAKALRKLSSVKLDAWTGGRTTHLAGAPVGEGRDTVVSIEWGFEDASELNAFGLSKGRVGIVDVERLFMGPLPPGRDPDEGVAVVERHLRFHPPEKLPEDWLDQHPLRPPAPLLYSAPMSIEFRAKWEEPMAFVVSLRGTNMLVLSHTKEMEYGRGVHIWQEDDLTRIDEVAPEYLRATWLVRHPDALSGDAAQHRYFQFEPDRWYRVRFVKGEKFATLWVDGRMVVEEKIKQYAEASKEIVVLTWTPMHMDDLKLEGTVDMDWYRRENRGK